MIELENLGYVLGAGVIFSLIFSLQKKGSFSEFTQILFCVELIILIIILILGG